ncbi:hypothetical protein EK21DRAFT_78057 [Setomelanomma holmii]|uniref:75k gamma secalin n=1 Tax=Setomelanomma holmii TaxID=210430 RepID=A0A9P4GZW1_9PLEO|nr:hypothetical protein EK21DRAFT_78057 [Setomelanomma holmii]
MDPRHTYNWLPQQYANRQYVPYTPPQQQPNAYPQHGYPQQYPPMQPQMPQGFPQSQPQPMRPQVVLPQMSSQQYPPMAQAYRQQQQPRAQSQVVIPARTPSYSSPMQHMQPPKIRHVQVQVPVQRTSNAGIGQMDGSQDNRRYSAQPTPAPPTSKQVHRSQSHQENGPRPQQRTPSTPALPADLSVMLLSAADEYIAAARGMGALVVREKREADLRQYYKLMATGMGCMDTVLRDFTLMPRDEAKLRLRYASLLVEETDNTTEIDEVLSKQISLCGRSRLQDLKYASLHLQARYQFKTNHRAALKALDKPISEAETFQHIAWVYAFRFLKVSLTLQIPGRVETTSALQQLHAILAHAERQGDRAIYVAGCALEAMVHLRSIASDRLEQAQRSIAAARSLQLQVSAAQLGSFGTLIDIIDVACGIQKGNPDNKKATALIESMFDEGLDSMRSETGSFTVLVERSFGGSLTYETGNVFRKNADRKDELVFTWLPKEDVKTLCLYISAVDQNIHEKAITYIKEAHSRSRNASKRHSPQSTPIALATAQMDWNQALDWHAVFAAGLIGSFREDQRLVNDSLAILRKRVAKSSYNGQDIYTRTLSYLTAIVEQKAGSLDSASRTYATNLFQLPEKSSSASAKIDLTLLAGLNRLLIIRFPGHPQHNFANDLLLRLQPFCEDHPNEYIQMAYRLMRAMCSPDASINRQKTLMQTASNRANDIVRRTQNREFVIMALCYFTMSFFADQVGEKSIQAIRATRQNAKLCKKPLWLAVAFGLCMSTYQRNGLIEEAQKAQQEYEEVKDALPAALTGGNEADAEGEDDS